MFYGQCSEICGINHGFMPIVVEGVSMKEFVYRKYVDALLNIVEDNPDLDMIENTSSSIKVLDNVSNKETVFNLESLNDKNYLVELVNKNN